jgi:hypothetical protein
MRLREELVLHHSATPLRSLLAVSLLPSLFASSLLLLPRPAHATSMSAECAAMYGPGIIPSLNPVMAEMPNTPRPLKGIVQRDPHFGSCLVRATDHQLEPPTNFARNDYSRRQAFNADNSRFIVYASGGGWHLYDADSLGYVRRLAIRGNVEPQWDAADPSSLFFIPSKGGMGLYKLNVDTNASVLVADFTGRLPWPDVARVETRGEGSPSADGRYWCFLAETAGAQVRGVFTYDLLAQAVIGVLPLGHRPNHVSMSPSGRYCVIEGTTAWDAAFTTSRNIGDGSHGDLAIGSDGHDQFVFVNQAGDGYLTMTDLDTGARTRLLPTWIGDSATSLHVSGKAFSRPGWVLLSTFNARGAPNWLHGRVMAVELKPNPTVVNLAHHHASWNGYWTEPHATVSRDFTRVLFNSNWGSPSNMDVDAYLIKLADTQLFGAVAPLATPPYTPPAVAPSPVAPPAIAPAPSPIVPPPDGGPATTRLDVLDPDDTGRGATREP